LSNAPRPDAGATSGTSVVLLDIEGTTTPITFVYDVLFPYARAHLRQYLGGHAGDPDVAEAARLLRAEHDGYAAAKAKNLPGWSDDPKEALLEAIHAFCLWLMDRDVKSPGLKLLQGLVWEAGYRSGEILGEVFEDVPPALERWRGAGVRAAIYSSGSVLAQKLLFGHTRYGDLNRFLSAYFDTAVGPKREAASYARISDLLGVNPAAILFLSDAPAELEAAAAAGMRTGLCVRPGNAPGSPPSAALVLRSFSDLLPAV
jgi:enolase-phosphatase E1